MMAGKNYKTGIIITGDANGGIKAVEATDANLKKLSATGKRTSKSMKEVGESAKSMAKNVVAVGAAAATAAAAYVVHNAGQIKQQQMLADAIGVSSQSMSGLAYAARDTIITQEKLGDILKDTSEKIGDYIVTGGGAAADTLDRLNLSAKDLAGLSPDQQLLKIAGALDQVGTKSEKIFLLENLASDASLLLPLLEDDAAGLRAAQKEAMALGISLSDIDSSMVAQSSSDFGRLTAAAGGFGNILTAEVMPVFGAYAGMIVDSIVQTDSLRGSTLNLTEDIIDMVSDISWVFRTSSAGFGAMQTDLMSVVVAWKKARYEFHDGLFFISDETQVKYLQSYQEAFNTLGEMTLEQSKRVDSANEDMGAGIRARIASYELEAKFKKDLIDLGFEESKVIGDTTGQIKAKTDALKAEKKEWDAILDSALATAEQEQKAMEGLWADRATAKFDNAQGSQWDSDVAAFDKADSQDELLAQTLDMATAVDSYGDAWTRTGDKALDALGSMLSMMDKVGANDKKYADQMQLMRSEGLDQTEEFIKLEKARAKNSVRGSMSMLDASVAMFEEGSAAQEAAHKLSLVMHAVEMGMELQKQFAAMTSATTINAANESTAVSGATASVASSGTGDPYSAPFRVLAMTAMMAGVLSQIGVAFGGSSGAPSASYAKVTQSDSGVLGGGDSNAIDNLSQKLMDVNSEQYNELREINQNTKFLNQAMVSASSALYSTGAIGGLSTDLSSFQKSDAVKLVESISDSVANIPLLGVFGDVFGGFISNVASAIFGGGTSRTSVGYGLNVNGDLGNVGVGGYQTIKKKTDGGWFGKSKTSYYDVASGVDAQVSEAINDTFNYLGDTLSSFGDLLDRDVTSLVDNLRVTTGKISLTGKTSAEVQQALTDAINVQSDAWAYEIFSAVINRYQKLEESAFDTLSRLVIDKVVVEDVLKNTGQTVVGDALDLSQALISVAGSLEALTDSANTYYDAFYSDAEKQARLTEQLTGALGGVNLALPNARDGYRSLVESMDLSTESGQSAYVTLLELSDSADKYYSEMESLQSDYFDTQISLIQTTIDAYSGLKDALQSTYDSIMGINSANAMDYMSAQGVISDAVMNARGGNLPELAAIQGALGVVGANSMSNYSSYEAYQRDQMITANMVDELIGYTDGAITVQDSMLSELEAQTALLSGIAIISTVDGSHATGLATVPFDGYRAELHKDEAVIDARTMQGLRKYGINTGGSSDALIVEVKALRNDVINMQATLHGGNVAIATNTQKMSKVMDKWDNDGQPGVRV